MFTLKRENGTTPKLAKIPPMRKANWQYITQFTDLSDVYTVEYRSVLKTSVRYFTVNRSRAWSTIL